METVTEEWRAIPDYPGYEASNLGRIRSVDRIVVSVRKYGPVELRWKGRILKNNMRDGYYSVSIEGAARSHGVHQAVAMAFIGKCPDGMQIDHKNGNKLDNRPENLEYVTPKENSRRAIAMGLKTRNGTGVFKGKLSADHVREIRRLYSLDSKHELAIRYSVTPSHIHKIAKRRAYWHVQDADEVSSKQ